ncbi:MAG: thiamine phosphate synthase, partial [Thermodesulfovibrionales bacterium]
LERLKFTLESLRLPVFAIGGIKIDNLQEVIKINPHGIAVISGILESKDVYETTKRYIQLLGE